MASIIDEAEARWLDLLRGHCRMLFANVFLPSHDHLHHDRVWSNARSLLLLLESAGARIPPALPEQLLIAVYFHDAGLTKTRGEEHGKESRQLCEEFFQKQGRNKWSAADSGLPETTPVRLPEAGLETIFHAIEYHDDKSLKTGTKEFIPPLMPDLLSLLSTADDLDAFGRLGIYRYAEIYLLRGTDPHLLPARVTENVKDRFMNIRRKYARLEDFVRMHESRYLEVFKFYMQLGQALLHTDERPSWEPVLMDIFKDNLENKFNLLMKDRLLPQTEFDKEIREWFGLLDLEIQRLPDLEI